MEEKLLRLSLKYNFVTKLTSMVVTTPDDQTIESNDPMQRSEDLYQASFDHSSSILSHHHNPVVMAALSVSDLPWPFC